jgi:integrase
VVKIPITKTIADILNCCGERKNGVLVPHHPEWVFTYIAARTDPRKGVIKGQRYPITREGAKTQWRRLIKRAGLKDFRMHDLRHDMATKLLRGTGNMAAVQKALNHADIKTTARYAHVTRDDLRDALTEVQAGMSAKRPIGGRKRA